MCFINDQTRRGPFRTEPTGKLALDWTHHPEIDLTLERDVIEALPPPTSVLHSYCMSLQLIIERIVQHLILAFFVLWVNLAIVSA